MLKTEVISVEIPAIFPWSVRDCEQFCDGQFCDGRFWDQFWSFCIAFPQIPLLQIPRWENENLRSIYSNWNSSLRVNQLKVLSFRLRFLFNDLGGQPCGGVTTRGSSISWRQGSSRNWVGGVSNVGFWVGERSSVELAFVGEICNSGEEVVERRFSNRGVLGKEALWNEKFVSNSLSLFS